MVEPSTHPTFGEGGGGGGGGERHVPSLTVTPSLLHTYPWQQAISAFAPTTHAFPKATQGGGRGGEGGGGEGGGAAAVAARDRAAAAGGGGGLAT